MKIFTEKLSDDLSFYEIYGDIRSLLNLDIKLSNLNFIKNLLTLTIGFNKNKNRFEIDAKIDVEIENYLEIMAIISETFDDVTISVIKEDVHNIYDESFKSANGLLVRIIDKVKYYQAISFINKINNILKRKTTNRVRLKLDHSRDFVNFTEEDNILYITAIQNYDYLVFKKHAKIGDDVYFYDHKDLQNNSDSIEINIGTIKSIDLINDSLDVKIGDKFFYKDKTIHFDDVYHHNIERKYLLIKDLK